jgi:hypothetical protein
LNGDRQNENEEDESDFDRLFTLAPDFIQFHLLEAIVP